jgi:hypothetical protein
MTRIFCDYWWLEARRGLMPKGDNLLMGNGHSINKSRPKQMEENKHNYDVKRLTWHRRKRVLPW